MSTQRASKFTQLLLLAGALVAPLAIGQTVPPPGVGAARPPTERTLQPVDRSQTRERVRTSRDCRKEVADIKAQYRIQERSVGTQYEPRIAAADGAEREAAVRERDAKIAQLHRESDVAAKRLGDQCHEDNASLLQNTGAPLDRPSPP